MPITNTQPLFFQGDNKKVGCLLIHKFTGTPINLMPIAKMFMQYGFTVYAPVLKGHGTKQSDLLNATYLDWIHDVKNAIAKLKEMGLSEIIVCGHSYGGLLALYLAENDPCVKAVLPINAPIRVHDSSIYYCWRLPHINKYKSFPYSQYENSREYNSAYDSFPISKQKDLCMLMNMVEKNFGKITCPMLVVQSKKDEIVRTKSAWMICERTNAQRKEVLLLKDSGHDFMLGNENEKVETKIHSFLHNIGYTLPYEEIENE